MAVRVVIAGILGGVVLFFWGAVSHMATPLGTMGLKQITTQEDDVLKALKANVTEPGVYFVPGFDMSQSQNSEAYRAHLAKLKEGPSGLLILHPEGSEGMTPARLGTEFLTGIVAALLAAGLLSTTRLGYLGRVGFVTALGVFAWVAISVPYWNWYGFSEAFTLGEGIDSFLGWLLAGLALAAVVRPATVSAELS